MEDEIVKALQKEIDKEETTFEQKQYHFDKMAEAAVRKEGKDTEHKNMVFNNFEVWGRHMIIGKITNSNY